MTGKEWAVLAGAAGVVVAALVVMRPKGQHETAVDQQIDPQWGVHRGVSASYPPDVPSVRMPSAQDKRGGFGDYAKYPYGSRPSSYAQGHWVGPGPGPIGYAPLDYGHVPVRIPKLWKDNVRYWDSLNARAGVGTHYERLHLLHLRPSYPTRGYRSISGVLYNGGPTASRARIPAIFVPSAVS